MRVEVVSNVDGGASLERLGSEEGVGRKVGLDGLRCGLRRSLPRKERLRWLNGFDGRVMRRLESNEG